MNINRKKQSQFELFPGAAKNNNPEASQSVRIIKDLTLSPENIIVLCIIFVMVVVLFFSFGVEKGKRIAALSAQDNNAQIILTDSKDGENSLNPAVVIKQEEEQEVFTEEIPENGAETIYPTVRPPLERIIEEERLFTIQVASFKLKENAEREAERLKGGGHEEIFVMAKGNYSIVCVGKFARRIEAKNYSNKLKSSYNDCLVRRL